MVFSAFTSDINWHPLHPDVKGLLVALDKYADLHPNMYEGHERNIEAALTGFEKTHPKASGREVLSEYFKICRSDGVNPLKDISLAYIGGGDSFPDTIAPLRGRFRNFADIQLSRGRLLSTNNIERYTQKGRFDIVVTANVLNDPRQDFPEDLFAASALLARPKGLIAHVVGRNANYTDHVLSKETLQRSGQNLLGILERDAPVEIGKDGINPIYAIFCQPCIALKRETPLPTIDPHRADGRLRDIGTTPPL
ncbi:MAG: hypothetical protein U1E36_08540 [Rickettsiales bacterium]